MKIAIDASNLSGKKTGIDFMTEGIIEGFASFPEHKYLIYVTEKFRRGKGMISVVDQNPGKFEVVRIKKPSGVASGLRWYLSATRDMRRKQVDAFISTWTFTASLLFPRTIQIIPDLSPFVFPQMYKRKHRFMFRLTLWLATLRAWKFVTISEAMVAEIRDRYPKLKQTVTAIPLSLNNWALQRVTGKQTRDVIQKYQLPDNYLISISTIQPRKNYENMLKAFAMFSHLHPEYHYLIVGQKGWLFDEVFALVKNMQIKDKVQFLDYAPDADLPALLDRSSGLMYASFYEGFGIPALNAAYRGVPVLVSELPVFREILTEKKAVFVNPHVADSIARGIEQLVEKSRKRNYTVRDEEILHKFSWKNAAAKLIETAGS